jgi:hypothetical protein
MTTRFDDRVKELFDDIVAHTPDPGEPPTEVTVLLTPVGVRPSKRGLAVAATIIAVAGVAGLTWATRASDSQPSAPAARPSTAPVPTAATSMTAPATASPTTLIVQPTELIAAGSVVCVHAGADAQVMRLCVDELGGAVVEASASGEQSFVMPVDPANPAHAAAAATVGAAIGVEVRPFDPALIPPGTATSASVYLVLGRDNPYGP